MARSWLITGRGVAKKIRNAPHCSNRLISELGVEACRECPNCKHLVDNSDVAIQWPGLPVGVKFDPSDLELLEHLEGKIGLEGSESHMFIDEFIPTLENDEGICYSHPENLPGLKKDGSSAHFFHRVSNAYGSGQRKRRRISSGYQTVPDEHVRWHKTGRSKAIYGNGVQKGWKKIMVLYKNSQGSGKAEKANWVMHQYHLGEMEKEKDGELVVCKIFYQLQTKQTDKLETEAAAEEEFDAFAASVGPKTPKTNTPQPRRPNNSPSETEQNASILPDLEGEHNIPIISLNDDTENPAWFAESHPAVDAGDQSEHNLYESLRCDEVLDSSYHEPLLPFDGPILCQDTDMSALYGLADLHGVDLGTPPDLQLSDFPFCSQESLGSWLDRI